MRAGVVFLAEVGGRARLGFFCAAGSVLWRAGKTNVGRRKKDDEKTKRKRWLGWQRIGLEEINFEFRHAISCTQEVRKGACRMLEMPAKEGKRPPKMHETKVLIKSCGNEKESRILSSQRLETRCASTHAKGSGK
jgi:hypothetical protein